MSYQQQPMHPQHPQHPQQIYGHPNYTQQPMYQEKMSLQVDPLNAKGANLNSSGKRDFSTGLCGAICAEAGTCVASCLCCAPCIHGNSKHHYSALSTMGAPATSNGWCSGATWAYILLSCFGVGCLLDCALRGDLRQRYSISGGCCGDFCASCCCLPCNQAQMRHEIRLEEMARSSAPPQHY